MRRYLLTAVVLLCALAPLTLSAAHVFRSTGHQATLLELYTSEGCSSCPPADEWFSGLLNDPRLWRDLIPVAFHVDYWNYLGWEDRFAMPGFGERQRQYRRQGTTNGVYTPGVVAAGQEWRSWRRAQAEVPRGDGEPGVLELTIKGDGFEGSLEPGTHSDEAGPLLLHVAVLGFDLVSPVKSGENRGRMLTHDFVVLGYSRHLASDRHWAGPLPDAPRLAETPRHAVVAWVGPANRIQPLQAVGGWVDLGVNN